MFYLRPAAVVHGQIWQLVTYAFFHDPHSVLHLLFNMLGLWMFGAQFEMDFGSKRFYEFYFWCVVGAAITTVGVGALGLLAYQHVPLPLFAVMGNIWQQSTIGASGGVYGLLLAFGISMATGRSMSSHFPSRSRPATLWRSGSSSPL